jgi:hypothetical protein
MLCAQADFVIDQVKSRVKLGIAVFEALGSAAGVTSPPAILNASNLHELEFGVGSESTDVGQIAMMYTPPLLVVLS